MLPSTAGWLTSHTTPHPSLVPVSARVEPGMKTDCDRTPTGLLKSCTQGEKGVDFLRESGQVSMAVPCLTQELKTLLAHFHATNDGARMEEEWSIVDVVCVYMCVRRYLPMSRTPLCPRCC